MGMQESQATIVEQVRLVQEYWPLLSLARRVLAEPDTYKRAMLISDGAEWLSSKSKTRLDDEAVRLITDLLRTPQGEQFIRWAVQKAEAIQ
jgi:hypothetical protein